MLAATTTTTILAAILVWTSFSAPLDRRGITSALFLMLVGFLVSLSAFGLLDVSIESTLADYSPTRFRSGS